MGIGKIMNQDRKKALINLKKARSHIDNVIKMMDEGKYCINVMQQNLAVIGLLKLAHRQLMEGHLNSCFRTAVKSKNERMKKKMVEEILQVTKLVNK